MQLATAIRFILNNKKAQRGGTELMALRSKVTRDRASAQKKMLLEREAAIIFTELTRVLR